MISRVLHALERGLLVMRMNSRMLLVGVLVFVFPLLFVWVTQSFFDTAYNNINTAEKSRVGMLHDSLGTVFTESNQSLALVDSLFATYGSDTEPLTSSLTKLRLVAEDEEGIRILMALNPELIDTYEKTTAPYQNLPTNPAAYPVIHPIAINGERVWQVFSKQEKEGETYFFFSEHSFAQVDATMSSRRQQSYFGLTAIFVFLILLAYWLKRQTDWERRHARLAEQLKERDLFSNMIAHEFRSPLTAIKGYASFLQESKTLTANEQRYAGNIRNSAEHLVSLVSDFLEVARLQSGKLKIDRTLVDVQAVTATVVEDLQGMAAEKGLALTAATDQRPVQFETDPARLKQVLTNVVSNAIKYTDKGKVELDCEQKAGEVRIRVKDTGMGISAEDQKKLFAPFTRVGGVDSGSITGTGLGMYITKQLVTMLGGTIGVESIKGVGTHIVITFREQ